MKHWKALYVASRSEKKIYSRLTDAGLETYLPLKKEKRQWSDRKKLVITPLLNGYIFVNVDAGERDKVFNTPGVIQYVRYNGGDAIIRQEEIDTLKEIELKGYHVEEVIASHLVKGERALIKYGQFKGMYGIVEREEKKNIYIIQLESIGYSLKITLPAEVLSKSDQ